MIGRILAASDFSKRSQAALDRAADLARRAGAELVLLHVVDEDAPGDVVADRTAIAERELERERAALDEVEATATVVVGDPFAAMDAAARAVAADLIVAGDHRRSLLRDLFLDTTIERLVRVASVPVLVARGPATTAYVHALVGVEAEPAAPMLAVLDRLGGAAPAHVTLLHAFDPLYSGKLAQADAGDAAIRALEAETAEALRRDLRATAAGVADVRVVGGEPLAALEAAVVELDADLVVTATHARRGLGRLVLGSVTSRLLREGDRDLLVIPPALLDGAPAAAAG